MTIAGKSQVFNRRYIFKWLVFSIVILVFRGVDDEGKHDPMTSKPLLSHIFWIPCQPDSVAKLGWWVQWPTQRSGIKKKVTNWITWSDLVSNEDQSPNYWSLSWYLLWLINQPTPTYPPKQNKGWIAGLISIMVGWLVMIFVLRSTSCGLKVLLSLSLILLFTS